MNERMGDPPHWATVFWQQGDFLVIGIHWSALPAVASGTDQVEISQQSGCTELIARLTSTQPPCLYIKKYLIYSAVILIILKPKSFVFYPFNQCLFLYFWLLLFTPKGPMVSPFVKTIISTTALSSKSTQMYVKSYSVHYICDKKNKQSHMLQKVHQTLNIKCFFVQIKVLCAFTGS